MFRHIWRVLIWVPMHNQFKSKLNQSFHTRIRMCKGFDSWFWQKEPGLQLRHRGLGQRSSLGGLRWFRFAPAKVPPVGLPSVVNAEDTPGLRRVRAEDGLVKSKTAGQGREGNALEVLRVEGPEQSDGSPAYVRIRVQLREVNTVDHPLQERMEGGTE